LCAEDSPSKSEAEPPAQAAPGPASEHIHENIGSIVAFQEREHQKLGASIG
jgi:hypothetical protein